MKRFWVSWYSGNYEDEGCTAPPFQFWTTGQRSRPNEGMTDDQYAEYSKIMDEDEADAFLDKHARDDCTLCALIDAKSEDQIWPVIAKHFPDYRERFCEERPSDYVPGDRFRDFDNRTSLGL